MFEELPTQFSELNQIILKEREEKYISKVLMAEWGENLFAFVLKLSFCFNFSTRKLYGAPCKIENVKLISSFSCFLRKQLTSIFRFKT